MNDPASLGDVTAGKFHFLTVGTSMRMIRNLWDRIAERGRTEFSHLVHPTYDRASWPDGVTRSRIYFFRDDIGQPMPAPDRAYLKTLEGGDVPTIHNMIMSDRVVAKLPYEDALAYATFLARRYVLFFGELKPSVVIGDFDALHSALGLAVARQMHIPWFAMNFSTIPKSHVSCCVNLSPASLAMLEPGRQEMMLGRADEILRSFEEGITKAPAYIPPSLLSPKFILGQLPAQLNSVMSVVRRRRTAEHRRFSDYRNTYTISGMLGEALRLRRNIWRTRGQRLVDAPVRGQSFAFFGLHMQPEASIDVFAHFFSNQMRVIELIVRSLPPTHALLVKLHKSDVPNYSPEFLRQLARFPGIAVVAPNASARQFIEQAALVFGIQGTIGLEAALLGRPVIMFGDSPVKTFPSVSTFGKTIDLPDLVRQKLGEPASTREQRVAAFARYLAHFYPASHNDWSLVPTDAQIGGYVKFFDLVAMRVCERGDRLMESSW